MAGRFDELVRPSDETRALINSVLAQQAKPEPAAPSPSILLASRDPMNDLREGRGLQRREQEDGGLFAGTLAAPRVDPAVVAETKKRKPGLLGQVGDFMSKPRVNGLNAWDMLGAAGAALSDDPRAVDRYGYMIERKRQRRETEALAGQFDTTLDAGPQPRETRAQNAAALRKAMLKASARGVDIRPYQALLEKYETDAKRADYLATVPEEQRTEAELDMAGDIAYRRSLRKPDVREVGGNLISVNGGKPEVLYTGPKKAPPGWEYGADGKLRPIPGGPEDLDRIESEAERRARGGRSGAPPISEGADANGLPISVGRVIAPIFAKLAQGQPLTKGEQEALNYYKLDPLTAGAMANMGGEEQAPAEPRPRPRPKSAGAAPRDATQRRRGTVYDTPRGPMTWTGTGWTAAQ